MDLFQKCREYTRAKQAMTMGIYPFFHTLTSGQDTEVLMDGHRTLMLGSNNYLGLTADPRVKEAAIRAIQKYGSGCSGSRFLNGTLDIHVALEQDLARFLQKDDCLIFSTGFQTNLSIISSIAGRNDYILSDAMNHASIIDGTRLSFAKTQKYKHSDMEDLARLLESCAADEKGGILIVTDGVFSMEGEICALPDIVKLARRYGARIMVDDAHAIGVLGERGRGTAEYFGLTNEVDLIMNTFSKTLASLGGCVAGDADAVHYIKHTARPFIFSASIPPAQVAAAHEALRILEAEPQRVRRLNDIAAYMKNGLKNLPHVRIRESGNDLVPIIPILTGNVGRTLYTAKKLLDRGVYVNPVFPPAVPRECCLLRTSYTATHTDAQLNEALEIIGQVFTDMAEETQVDFDVDI
ncbi:MAG: pyridoxal phosphate-dependent aminotransferase family protein [Clostridiaceae bacterium]|nr:pyridoxal phosphate-dependent aminotransferase family protein [Clostridiaceae bacterium]